MKNVTERQLKEYAEAKAETIVIRTYEEGNSSDIRRLTTAPEETIIFKILYGALLAMREVNNMYSAISAAEYIGDLMIPQMNGYDTIYCPLTEFYDWKEDNSNA